MRENSEQHVRGGSHFAPCRVTTSITSQGESVCSPLPALTDADDDSIAYLAKVETAKSQMAKAETARADNPSLTPTSVIPSDIAATRRHAKEWTDCRIAARGAAQALPYLVRVKDVCLPRPVAKPQSPLLQPLEDVSYTEQQLNVAAAARGTSGHLWRVEQSEGTLTFYFRDTICLVAHCKKHSCAVLWNPEPINISATEAHELFCMVMKIYVLEETGAIPEHCSSRMRSLLQTTNLR